MLHGSAGRQAVFQLNHAGRTTRRHNIRATPFNRPSLPFENFLCGIILFHDVGSRTARTAVGVLHLDVVEARDRGQQMPRLGSHARRAQVTGRMIRDLARLLRLSRFRAMRVQLHDVFRDMLHVLRNPPGLSLLGFTLEKLGIILERQRTGRTARDDHVIPCKIVDVITSPFPGQGTMPIRFKGRPGASLRRKVRRYAVLPQDVDHGVTHSIIEVIGGAPVKIRDLRWGAAFPRSVTVFVSRNESGRRRHTERVMPFTQQRRRQARQFHVPGKPCTLGESRQKRSQQHFADFPNKRPIPERLSFRSQLDQPAETLLLRVQGKDFPGERIRMFRPFLQNQLGHVHVRRADGPARFAIQARLHDSLGLQIAVVRGGDDFIPPPGAHIFRLKHVVHRADRIAFRTRGTGFPQPFKVDVFGKGGLTDFHAGIQHPGRVHRMLDLDEETVQLFAEHPPDHFGTDSAIPVFPANGSLEPIENRVMHLIIRVHHSLKIPLVIHVQQRHDVGIAVADMSENRHPDLRGAEDPIQIANQLAHVFHGHDDVIDVVDGLFLGVVPI